MRSHCRNIVIIGAGRVGRGFIAEMFLDAGWDVCLVDIDAELINALNAAGRFTLHKYSKRATTTRELTGFTALHTSQISEVCDQICRAGALVAVCVPAASMQDVASFLSVAIARRAMELPDVPLDILLCVNTMLPAHRMRTLLDSTLGGSALDYLHAHIGLVDTVVMRMSPYLSPELAARSPLDVVSNGFSRMPVDALAFKGVIPTDVGMIRPFENINALETRKIYTVNMSHAVLAYIGATKGYTALTEAVADKEIAGIVSGAVQESAFGLCEAYGFDPVTMREWCSEVLDMPDNPPLADSLARLGADTARKLSVSDRLVGPALLCLKAGRVPYNIVRAIAAGYLFTLSNDPGTQKVQRIVDDMGIAAAVEIISGFDFKHPLQSLVLEAYDSIKQKLEENTK